MNRFEMINKLNGNWKDYFGQKQIRTMAERTRKFDDEVLRNAIEWLIDNHTGYPPKAADLRNACFQEQKRLHLSGRDDGAVHLPGDVVDGERTFTPLEAMHELERIRREFPEAFAPRPPKPLYGSAMTKEYMETLFNRIYVSGLRRAMAHDPTLTLTDEEGQQELEF